MKNIDISYVKIISYTGSLQFYINLKEQERVAYIGARLRKLKLINKENFVHLAKKGVENKKLE